MASPPGCEEIDDWQEETVPALAGTPPALASEQTPVNAGASPAHRVFNAATGKQASLTPVLNTLADGLGARLWGNVRYKASQGRIEQVQQAPFQKSLASIKDKIRRHLRAGMTAEQATQSVGDALRYALELPSEGFVAKVQAAQDALRRQGMTCVNLQNYFTSGDGTYRASMPASPMPRATRSKCSSTRPRVSTPRRKRICRISGCSWRRHASTGSGKNLNRTRLGRQN